MTDRQAVTRRRIGRLRRARRSLVAGLAVVGQRDPPGQRRCSSSTSPSGHDPADADRDPGLRAGRRRRPARRRHRRRDHRRPQPLRPVPAARPGALPADPPPPTRCRASPTGGRSMRRRWSSAPSARQPDGRLRAEFRLWDVFAGQQIAGQQYLRRPRELAAGRPHHRRRDLRAADRREGLLRHAASSSSTRPARRTSASSASRSWTRTAPMSATSPRATDLVLTPRFSPTSQDIAYMSYERRRAERLSPQRRDRPAPAGRRFSRHDLRAALLARRAARRASASQQGGNTNIFDMDLQTRGAPRSSPTPRRSTPAPSYSPDGAQIVFESDRGGSQQLYVMNADGSNPQRITFGEGSYSTPVWSPRGDLIAFTRQARRPVLDRRHQARRQRASASSPRASTTKARPGRPTAASSCSSATRRANGGPQLWTIDLTGYNEYQVADAGLRLRSGLVALGQLSPPSLLAALAGLRPVAGCRTRLRRAVTVSLTTFLNEPLNHAPVSTWRAAWWTGS